MKSSRHTRQSAPAELEERIGYRFRDRSLFLCAMTHSSYINEHDGTCYERLEFLGDAVLEMISSAFLYEHFPDMREGEMTRLRAELVCEAALSSVAKELGLADYLRLGRGEEAGGGRKKPSILCDITESLIGAIYLDSGRDVSEAERFVKQFILKDPEELNYPDTKSLLQEQVQKEGGSVSYELVDRKGPAHAPVYTVRVLINGTASGTGQGKSKKNAEQAAARSALELMRHQDG